jgi:uncharacterized protein
MFFHLTELEHHPIHFDVTYEADEIGLPEDLRQISPLRVAGQAELLRNTLGEIRLRGELSVNLEGDCDRCLESAPFPLAVPFDLYYRPLPPPNPLHPEVHLGEGEIDISFYEGDGVSLRDALRELIVLSRPMRLFCRPDCQGLCPVCGGNRNTERCQCSVQRPDPRWEALKNL